jgi:hypothetical protein
MLTKKAAQVLGRAGGLSRSEAKQRASKANGRAGGRPRKDGRRCVYRVSWATENAGGLFPQKFTSRKIAERVGKAWKSEMVAIDENPQQAELSYSWEIVEEDIVESDEEDCDEMGELRKAALSRGMP